MRDASLAEQLFTPAAGERLAAIADVAAHVMTDPREPTFAPALAETDVLLTGWGAPPIDAELLARTPQLSLVAHAAGTVKRIATAAAFERGVRFSSAADANAVPVAEYTLAMILLAGKRVFESQEFLSTERNLQWAPAGCFGNNGVTVGIVGASRIGQRVLNLLRPFDFRVLLCDPTISAVQASELGAEHVPLEELLSRSAVTSLHAPLLESTDRMLGASELALMPDHATLINTARGRLVDTEALVTQLSAGRIHAVLDVTDPEPLPADHALYRLPGVTLTPHVAGALGNELTRLGDHAIDEIAGFAASGTLVSEIHAAAMNGIA